MKKVAVIGSGTMGHGIAHVFAHFGYKVSLIDVNAEALQKARVTIDKNLDRQLEKGLLTREEKANTLERISLHTILDEGITGTGMVIEAATENVDLKLSLFKSLDEKAPPDAILASNTSSISITRIASVTTRPDRVIGMHFMNPVPVMKLVEVIRGYNTSNAVTATVMDVARNLGKSPVEVNDYPGFVANRILIPMINEAISALHEGVAGVEEIDTVMKLGMAHPMGPLQLADFIGLDVCLSILNVLSDGFGSTKYAPSPLLVNMVAAGHKGMKAGQGFYQYTPGRKDLVVAERFRRLR